MTIKYIFVSVFLFSILFYSQSLCQPQSDVLKNEAKRQMLAGNYGDAIDLLNHYISGYPQESDGYNLRGVCYEKRAQYEMAVYDFRSARKLRSDDAEINRNLARTTDAWYKLLYDKIEGHKREIAVYPDRPVNYLEIGKSYKNLGDWQIAENWYDKYLLMQEASPDEMIRYTEILARLNHIKKGEPLLKRYTEKYPDDQRLWSRYGYFELWLGKTQNAIYAFEKALAIKPYFKEAMNGLDIAKGNGYIYTVNDTSYHYGKSLRGPKQQEYVIDKYFRLLKKTPEDNELRFKLIDELLKHNRFEEAYEQLQILQPDSQVASSGRYKNKFDYVSELRDSTYKHIIKTDSLVFDKNNNNRKAAVRLSDSYAHLYDFDNAVDVLEKYLATVKENQDLDLRFMLAKYSGWSYKWDNAFNQIAILLKHSPENKDFKLFYARLIGWKVLEAKPGEIEKAKGYIREILKDDPKNLDALLTMCFLYAGKGNISEAEKYLANAKAVNPGSKDVEAVENYINTRAQVEKEREILNMRAEAGKLYDAGKYETAADKYNGIIAKLENPEKNILLEYAAYNTAAKRYDLAIKTYDKILQMGPDYNVASLRAVNYLSKGDTTRAFEELSSLKIERPYDFSVNFYLGDIYERTNRNDEAIDLYESIIAANGKNGVNLDSSQIYIFQTRLGYLKAGSGYGTTLLGYFALSPFASFYSDNQNFTLYNYGGRIETGIVPHVSLGASYIRYNIKSLTDQRYLTSFLGHLIFSIQNFTASVGLGQTTTLSSSQKNVIQAVARYEKKNSFGLSFSYEKNDARVLLYSPALLNANISADLYRVTGSYSIAPSVSVSGSYSYVNISPDTNSGHDLRVKLGRSLDYGLSIGYEFNYVSYARISRLYYSPLNFQSHSIWGNWNFYKERLSSFNAGGKLGYVPSYDFVLYELYGEAVYHPVPVFTVTGRISHSSTIRQGIGYNFWAGYITAYLSMF